MMRENVEQARVTHVPSLIRLLEVAPVALPFLCRQARRYWMDSLVLGSPDRAADLGARS